jgi:lipid II:glycine glycyltransferase (peptidoglycan interpeptide bridge formation enzyme)
MEISIFKNRAPDEFDRFVLDSPSGHFLQTTAFGRSRGILGLKPYYIVVRDADKVSACALVQRVSFPGFGSILYSPRGTAPPLPDSETFAKILDAVRKIAERENAFLYKIDPPVMRGDVETAEFLKSFGFRNAEPECSKLGTQSNAVFKISLNRTPEEIPASFDRNTRYYARYSSTRGVSICAAGAPEGWRELYHVLSETAKRKKFPVFPRKYYRVLLESFARIEALDILLSKYRGRTIAALAVVYAGRAAWFLYGGFRWKYRDLRPMEGLHLEAMLRAQKRGAQMYDMGGTGVLNPETEGEKHPLFGIYCFKKGFGGEFIRFIPEQDLVLDEHRYGIFRRLVPIGVAATKMYGFLQRL